MARRLNGTNQRLIFSAGTLAGVHAWGTVAVLFKRGSTGGVNWQCPVYSGQGGSGQWNLSFDITNTNVGWFSTGNGGHEATASTAMNSTTPWYLVVARKASGNVQPRISIKTLSTGVWSHQALTAFTDGGGPSCNQVQLGSFAGFDWFNGDIAAAAIIRNWIPANDAAVEALNLDVNASNWVSAAANAGAGAGVWIPGATLTSVAIQDLTGGGANETSSNVGTVVSDPDGFDPTIPSGDIELEAVIESVSFFSAAMQVEKELEASASSVSSFQANLRVGKELASSISSTSSFDAEMELANEFEAGINSTSNFTASLQVEKHLATTIQSQTEFEASMLGVITLAASIASQSSFEPTMGGFGNPLEASINSESSMTAELQVEKELEASINSTSSFRARLDIGQKAPFDPSAQVWLWGRNKWFDPQFIDRSVLSGNP